MGILTVKTSVPVPSPVGVRGWSIGRGEEGVVEGEEAVDMMFAADSGLLLSLR